MHTSINWKIISVNNVAGMQKVQLAIVIFPRVVQRSNCYVLFHLIKLKWNSMPALTYSSHVIIPSMSSSIAVNPATVPFPFQAWRKHDVLLWISLHPYSHQSHAVKFLCHSFLNISYTSWWTLLLLSLLYYRLQQLEHNAQIS